MPTTTHVVKNRSSSFGFLNDFKSIFSPLPSPFASNETNSNANSPTNDKSNPTITNAYKKQTNHNQHVLHKYSSDPYGNESISPIHSPVPIRTSFNPANATSISPSNHTIHTHLPHVNPINVHSSSRTHSPQPILPPSVTPAHKYQSSLNGVSTPVPTTPNSAAPSASPAPATTTRVPLSTIVTVLVDEWSRSYTVGALQGDIESMCMLSSAHFAKSGFGCIPHDPARGYDWLERAKKAVVEQAARDAKKYGVKICRRDVGQKEAEVEKDILTSDVFVETSNNASVSSSNEVATDTADNTDFTDDQMSSGSFADSLATLSCGQDTNSGFIADIALPSDGMAVQPNAIESDGNFFSLGDSSSSFHHHGPSTPSHYPRSLTRSSISHPDFTATPEWRKWTDERVNTATTVRTHAINNLPVQLYQVSESESEDETMTEDPNHPSTDSTHPTPLDDSVGSSIPNSNLSSEFECDLNSRSPSHISSTSQSHSHTHTASSSRGESPLPLTLVRSTTK